jgi:M6 family metalloprotease-like protein
LNIAGILAACLALTIASGLARTAPLHDFPVFETQPDGTVVPLRVTGDEFHRTVQDEEGFTVVRDPVTGWIVYADLRNGDLLPTGLAAGLSDPRTLGLRPGIRIDPAVIQARTLATRVERTATRAAPTTGVVTNLFIFVRFEDDDYFDESFNEYHHLFDSDSPEAPSLRNYFAEVSRGSVDVRTLFLPPPDGDVAVAYTVPRPRSFYREYNPMANPVGYKSDSEAQQREQELWIEVLQGIESLIPNDVVLDADGDGFVDNVIFMVQGWPDAWADLLWPHKWELWFHVPLGNAKVRTFNLQFTTLVFLSPGTFAHEMYHSFGAPDLYHYSQDGLSPVGPWDLMERTGHFPQHMLAYMKMRYGGWIVEIPEVDANSEIELHPSWETGTQAVQIAVPESTNQYFVLEYRRNVGLFEQNLPGSGLLAYRIDTRRDGVGNRNGPPDEVYVFRPGGDPTRNGRIERAPLSADSGRVRLSAWDDTRPFLHDGSDVTLRVYDVSTIGDTITFRVCLSPPDCGDRVCGDDGCGGQCGICDGGFRCGDGQCEPCSCEGRVCGDDGCGVSCGTCDDGNPCTDDACINFACVFEIHEDGFSCDDGESCTNGDSCVGGACLGTAYTCEPGICEVSSECDGKGGCKVTFADGGEPCDDGDPSTEDDACNGKGECIGTVPPDPDLGPGDMGLSRDAIDPANPDITGAEISGAPDATETDVNPPSKSSGCTSGPGSRSSALPIAFLAILLVLASIRLRGRLL